MVKADFYLVSNIGSSASQLQYKDKFKLFDIWENALKFAESIGYEDSLGIIGNVPPAPGVMHVYAGGDVNVQILGLNLS